MFARLIDDVKASAGAAVRQSALATGAAMALLVAIAFMCAAGFIFVQQQYGSIAACLAGAALFLVVALTVIGIRAGGKRQIEARAAERSKSTAHALLTDPTLLATGVQVVRAIGVKRLVPILAVGGLAIGLLARGHASDEAGDSAPAE